MFYRVTLAKECNDRIVVKLHTTFAGVNDNDERRTGPQIGGDFIVDIHAAIVGRKNLDRDVGESGGTCSSS